MYKISSVFKAALTLPVLFGAAAYADISFDSAAENASAWRFIEDPHYNYAKYSSSNFLSLREAVPHHALTITLQENIVDSYTFRVGCMLQSTVPVLELRVPSLDIRIFDTINGIVYARFMVDKGHEYSLRGEVLGRNRLIFAPITKVQEKAIAGLVKDFQKGEDLKIALLQGADKRVNIYNVPLNGFSDHSDRLRQSCISYNQYFNGDLKYLPDYMSKEPEGYAPSYDYSIRPKEEKAPVYEETVVTEITEITEKEKESLPEVMPFRGDGGPVSIGPDGLPVGVGAVPENTAAGSPAEQSLGRSAGAVSIGPDGKPIAPQNAGQGTGQNTGGGNAGAADFDIF